ncbi:LysR family transcriptional regulator [Gluconacetobacter azotocaptans]|uniref:LysR family transcriptional regulator n=4 Tax=Gluconacetobacter azotocaptans TaxID=142834 RepID=A0A7W4JUS1_9PROT|nr:LysR family transcriptional regulator [Gluconacetobacter azotocaptans]MBB2191290.1 LysR family transcriptional regulator [Gluconacetobacter azotocaptans]
MNLVPSDLSHFDWDNQRVFLAILTEGSLSAAARALHVAQPTVRRRLDALEHSIGTVLFTRSPAGLQPTPDALVLAGHAAAMASAAAAFARAASGPADGVAGTVRVTASEIVGTEILPPMLAALRARHPRLRLELHLGNRNEDLLRRDADIAVRMARPVQAALHARRIGAVPLGLFAAPAYVGRHGLPARLADLPRFALIGPDRAAGDLAMVNQAGLDLSRDDFALRTDNHVAQLAAIRAGGGIGICQHPLARRAPGLVPVLPDLFSLPLEMWVVMHEDLKRMRRVRTVFDHLARSLADYLQGRA